MATIEAYETSAGKRYMVRFRTPGGAQSKKRGFRTKRDATEFASTVEVAMRRGEYVAPSAGRTNFGGLAEAWFKTKVNLAASTRSRYRQALDCYVLPTFADKEIGQITPEAVRLWVADLDSKVAGHTVRKAVTILRQILDVAVEDKLLVSNPAVLKKASLPKVTEKPRRFLTAPQLHRLADGAEGERRLLILLLGYSGLRFGEAAALRVEDVNVLRGRLNVHASVTEAAGVLVWSNTKSGKGREVPLVPDLMALLAKHIEGKAPKDLVFPDRNGGPLRSRNVAQRWWVKAVAQAADAGVPGDLVLHELRHTAASLAISAGARIKTIQRMLGHQDASLTLNRYGHLMEDELDEVSAKLSGTWTDGCAQNVPTTLRLVQ
ncbi:tyrosine-type recombinase/integrase [Smaragdicoccus niigatensis]|uniref:tyrosine-type recombinase/integrase n=1 Tax=Smaragdicoccus niigatensis TaxID=359359 RepID=UPI00036E8D75|nr:site-specific integrase [Smaragdicoccus niigatensis]